MLLYSIEHMLKEKKTIKSYIKYIKLNKNL